MTTLNFETMTGAEIEQALAALRAIKKSTQDAQKGRYAELARPFVETLLVEHGVLPSDSSERVGYSTPSLSLEIDGREYTFYLALKDVKASEERKAAIERGEITLVKRRGTKKDDATTDASEEASEDAPEEDAEEAPATEPVSLVKE